MRGGLKYAGAAPLLIYEPFATKTEPDCLVCTLRPCPQRFQSRNRPRAVGTRFGEAKGLILMRNLLLCFVSRKSHAQASSPTASSGTLAVRAYALAARIQLSNIIHDHEHYILAHRPRLETATE